MPDTPKPANPTTAAARIVLAFDFGIRRIGVAVGNTLSGDAQPLVTLSCRDGPDWAAIKRLLGEWRPAILVVGLPLQQDGSEQPMSARARAFMAELGGRFALPVHPSDERYSSTAAAERLRGLRASGARRRRLRKGDSDAVAAQIILETWLAGA